MKSGAELKSQMHRSRSCSDFTRAPSRKDARLGVVRMTNVTSGKSIKASLDEGNDRLIATRVRAAEDAVFEGRTGVDI